MKQEHQENPQDDRGLIGEIDLEGYDATDDHEKRRGDAQTDRQAISAVDQVIGVGDADQPDHRQKRVEDVRGEGPDAKANYGYLPPKIDEQPGRQKLAQQFAFDIQAAPIVVDPEDSDHQGGGEDLPGIWRKRPPEYDENSGEDKDKDQAARQGRLVLMLLVCSCSWGIQNSKFPGDAECQRCE